MRITAQLIDAKSGYHLWSQTFDRNVTDVFAVQDEITSAIGNALRVRLIASTAVRAKESRPDNTAAHDLYLKGLFARNLRTQTGIRDAIGYFRSATATDSTYALAHAALARTLLMQAAYGYIALAKVLPDARAASIRAVRLAPSLVETRSSHAMMLDVEGRSQEAEAEIKQVVAQYPNYADARVVYSNFLSRQGRARESLEQLRAAQKLDPISVSNSIAMGIQFMFVRDYKAAVAELQRAFTLDPNNPTAEIMLASALSADGLHVEAVRIAEKTRAQASDDPWVALTLAYVYARAGETEKASAIMKAEEKDPAATEYAAEMAAAYGALGRKDAAFAWLNKIESIAGIYPRLDPMFDSLRGDPRFNAFLAKWS